MPAEASNVDRTAVDADLLARVRRISLRIRGLVSGALQGAYRSSVRGSGIDILPT